MAYTIVNYKTKKELKEALQRKECVEVFIPNSDLTGFKLDPNKPCYLEGPHFPEPHKWYAKARIKKVSNMNTGRELFVVEKLIP